MIKINLLKNITATDLKAVTTGMDSVFLAEEDKKEIFIKLSLIFGFVLCLIIWEFYNSNVKTNQFNKIQNELAKIDEEINSLGPIVNEIEKFLNEKSNLEKKFKIIGQLSSNRLLYVKAIASLQGIIPAQAWFTQIEFEGEKIKLVGESLDDNAILDFVKGLEELIFFSEVVLTSAVEVKSLSGITKKFEIQCTVDKS